MSRTKLTTKYQATIPKEVREALGIKAGDIVIFEIKEGKVLLKKGLPLDVEYLQSLNYTLNEWESEEDDKAYQHLQNI